MPLKNFRKPSDRIKARQHGVRFKRHLTARNMRAVQYGTVLEIMLTEFFRAVLESGQTDLNNPRDVDQIERAVELMYERWVSNPPDRCWAWLKNRSRFNYRVFVDHEQNQVRVELNREGRRFTAGEINDFGEVISQADLMKWDTANKENTNVPTTEAPGS
jgi:hypothetical protein